MRAAVARPVWGLLAEFDTHEALLAAVRRARAAGFTRMDAYSPYPLPDVSDAMGFTGAWKVAFLTLVGGLLGAGGGYALQYYLMAVDYPLNVGGRPLHSWPAFVPVTFELMVLFASIIGVVGLFVMNGLPRPHHPLFAVPEFDRATQDAFFVAIESSDPRFDLDGTRRFLANLRPLAIVEVPDD